MCLAFIIIVGATIMLVYNRRISTSLGNHEPRWVQYASVLNIRQTVVALSVMLLMIGVLMLLSHFR